MSDYIIKAENIGKSYFIGHQRQQGYTALRDVVTQNIKGFAKGIKNTFAGKQIIEGQDIEEFWALKDMSFEIKEGDAVGIIGRNGAGKSTLLKVLSRITEPTTGRITLNGRVASLLEVGTGFHPELSGRENIYLNGAILGMSRAEIKKKFDEIVDFSGVEKFLDTPVKRYSSGMYVRLAFSVAAHLEPEILVVDEVLAVGDAEFQKKCLGKMNDVNMKEGRTVLFVSHDMNAIKNLSRTAILLDEGKVLKYDKVENVIPLYLNKVNHTTEWKQFKDIKTPHFKDISIKINGEQPDLALEIEFSIKSDIKMKKAFVAFNLSSNTGSMVGQAIPCLEPFIDITTGEKRYKSEIHLAGFIPGTYLVSAWIGPHYSEMYDWQKEVVGFNIIDSPQKGRTFVHPAEHGYIVPVSKMINI